MAELLFHHAFFQTLANIAEDAKGYIFIFFDKNVRYVSEFSGIRRRADWAMLWILHSKFNDGVER